jgi:hypothetical protein
MSRNGIWIGELRKTMKHLKLLYNTSNTRIGHGKMSYLPQIHGSTQLRIQYLSGHLEMLIHVGLKQGKTNSVA